MKKILTMIFMVLSVFMLSQQSGMATYYGKNYHGRKTASGEIFNMYGFTCASSSKYKFGTMLEITNISNGKSVIVKVNDRGKDIIGNRIDLSQAAFDKIASLKTGVIKISIKVLDN